MAVPSKITDHTDRAYELLLGQFKDKPVIAALLKTWTDMIQEVEDDLYSLMAETLFLNAEGKNLERYGQLFGIPFPDGLTDEEYRELLIAEIMKRSSDGTPDRIRQILEATTGIKGARIFEHYNGNQTPWVMGCNLVYGYADEDVTFDVSLESKEAKFLVWASPITTGSCILGVHRDTPSNLFIPAEIVTPLKKIGLSSNKVVNPTFDDNLLGWTYSSPYISWHETFSDPEHPDGQLKVDVAGNAASPVFSQGIVGLTPSRSYQITFTQFNTQNYSSLVNFTTPDTWLPKFDRSVAANQRIVTPAFDAAGTYELSMDVIWDGRMGVLYLFDTDTSSPARRMYLSIDDGFLNIPDARIADVTAYVDGIPVSDYTYEFTPYKKTNIRLVINNGLAYNIIGNKFMLDSGFSGNIFNFKLTDLTTNSVLRNYPILTVGGSMPVTTTIDDTIGANDGTMTGFSTWVNMMFITTLVGNDTATLTITDTSAGTFTVTSNTGANTDGLFYFDQIELYDTDVTQDQDELVNEADDWIVVRGEEVEQYSAGYQNGILPEIENRIERFQVDTRFAAVVNPITGRGIEDFSVDTATGIDEFYIEYRNAGKPSRAYGVMLEISQILINEDIT